MPPHNSVAARLRPLDYGFRVKAFTVAADNLDWRKTRPFLHSSLIYSRPSTFFSTVNLLAKGLFVGADSLTCTGEGTPGKNFKEEDYGSYYQH